MQKTSTLLVKLVAAVPPALIILYLALHSGSLPDNDYWEMLGDMISQNGLNITIATLLQRSNEHIVIIPKIIYALNILLTSGSNYFLSLTTWFFALAQVILLFFVTPDDIRNKSKHNVILIFVISAFVFTPKAAHNWIQGMSGVAWITANLFAVFTIVCFCQYNKTLRSRWLWTCCGSGLLASLCYSTPLALWPALLFGALLFRIRPRDIFQIMLIALFAYLLFFLGYERPSFHPRLEQSILQNCLFALNFLGGLFIAGPAYSVLGELLALLGIVSSGVVIWLSARNSTAWRQELTPWLMLQVYAIGNAFLAASSRGGFGIDTALSSRYATLPAFFWLGLYAMWFLYLWEKDNGHRYLPALTAIVSILIFMMYSASTDLIQSLLHRAKRKSIASVSMLSGNFDNSILQETVTAKPEQVSVILDQLKAMHHIPFNNWPKDWPHIGEQLNVEPSAVNIGYFDGIEHFLPNSARVKGWSYSPINKVHGVAIVNQNLIVRGLAVVNVTERPDVATVLGISEITTGWEGYTRLEKGDQTLQACALMGTPGHWYLLNHSIPLTGNVNSQNSSTL